MAEWRETLLSNNAPNTTDFFLRTIFGISEPEPLPWFSVEWSIGKLLVTLWMFFCFFINNAYTCNLRSHIMRPMTEQPINTIQDLFDRGQKLWISYIPLDPNDPEAKDCFNFDLLSKDLRTYVREKNSSFAAAMITPKYVMDDIQHNGGSIVEFIEPSKDKYAKWRRAKENPFGSFQYQTFHTARKQVWKAQFNYWLIRLFEAGINTKLFRMETNYSEYIYYPNKASGSLF